MTDYVVVIAQEAFSGAQIVNAEDEASAAYQAIAHFSIQEIPNLGVSVIPLADFTPVDDETLIAKFTEALGA